MWTFQYDFEDLEIADGLVAHGRAWLAPCGRGYKLTGAALGWDERRLTVLDDASPLLALIEAALNAYEAKTGRLTDACDAAHEQERNALMEERDYR